jgi:hypothetical protein
VNRWSDDLQGCKDAQRAFKLPIVHDVEFATSDGVCETLEGPVPYDAGDAIMSGTIGEHWPISRAYFMATYEVVPPTPAGSDGQYRKRKIMVWVMQLGVETSVELSNGAILSGVPGDWLVQYEPGSFGMVEKEVFRCTYQLVG